MSTKKSSTLWEHFVLIYSLVTTIAGPD